jgi:hypothetical protein
MKNAAIPASTAITMMSRLRMPMFIPFAIGESERPKHAAQASTEDGKASAVSMKATGRERVEIPDFTGN